MYLLKAFLNRFEVPSDYYFRHSLDGDYVRAIECLLTKN